MAHEGCGLGTYAHLIMYPLVARNIKDCPTWAFKAVPSFFEKFYGYWRTNEPPVIHWGYHNPWRVELLGTNLTRLDLKSLLKARRSQDRYKDSDLRMVSMFLWDQGKFQKFLQLVQKREKNGYDSCFEAALEMPLDSIVPLWKSYLGKVAASRREIMRLPPSAVLKDETTFKRFIQFHGIPIASQALSASE